MADAARDLGLSYFGICDHSQSLTVAGGLSPEDVRQQQAEIDDLNAEFAADDGAPFRIFSGIESDILADGSLDYDDEVLASFDFVVASVHSRFNMSVGEATERLIRAVRNPFTTILGHPTGRLLLVREGYPIDHERVIDACAEHDVAIELNANPYRLDLDWRWIRYATDQGVLISINPDAHATDELRNVRWGVEVARKGWLTAEQCLNAKSLDAFADWLEARANHSAA
jgi:DNA polymerase (family 10)